MESLSITSILLVNCFIMELWHSIQPQHIQVRVSSDRLLCISTSWWNNLPALNSLQGGLEEDHRILLVNCSIMELWHSIQLQRIQVGLRVCSWFCALTPRWNNLPARWGSTTRWQHCLHNLRWTIPCKMDWKRITVHHMVCQITWFFFPVVVC